MQFVLHIRGFGQTGHGKNWSKKTGSVKTGNIKIRTKMIRSKKTGTKKTRTKKTGNRNTRTKKTGSGEIGNKKNSVRILEYMLNTITAVHLRHVLLLYRKYSACSCLMHFSTVILRKYLRQTEHLNDYFIQKQKRFVQNKKRFRDVKSRQLPRV